MTVKDWRQHGQVFRATEFKCGGPSFNLASGRYLEFFSSPWFNSFHALVNSQLVCLQPVGSLKKESSKFQNQPRTTQIKNKRCNQETVGLGIWRPQTTDRWSENRRSTLGEPLIKNRNFREVIRSKVCPRIWIGYLTCWSRPKHSKKSWYFLASASHGRWHLPRSRVSQ